MFKQIESNKALVIAEIGVNHDGNIDKAKRLVEAAAHCGADAVKFQLFDSDKLATKSATKANYQRKNTLDKAGSQLSMLKALELTYAEHRELKEFCKKFEVKYICTPYDWPSAQFLASDLRSDFIKIASTDTTNIPFLENIDTLGVHVLLSTGMCTTEDVERAVIALNDTKNEGRLCILQCTSEYPAPENEVNLNVLHGFVKQYGVIVGFSDHTIGTLAGQLAIAVGAKVIEKHFTLDREADGPDHAASMEPKQFAKFVEHIRAAEKIMGSDVKFITSAELKNQTYMQKSIYWSRDLQAGAEVTADDLAYKRPGNGLVPAQYRQIIGKILKKDVKDDQLVQLSEIE